MRIISIFILLVMLFPTSAKSNDIFEYDYSDFRRIPVQDNGRIKPLDKFAGVYLQLFYGKKSLPNKEAIAWLAEMLFNSKMAMERRIYDIPNPDVVNALNLEVRAGHKYSHIEVFSALIRNMNIIHKLFMKQKSEMSLAQDQLLTIYNKTRIFEQLSATFSLLIPQFQLNVEELGKELNLATDSKLSYLDIRKRQVTIRQLVDEIVKKMKDNPHVELSDREIELGRIDKFLGRLQRDNNSAILSIIPPQWDNGSDEYYSPWGIILRGYSSPQSALYLKKWAQLANAYETGETGVFKNLSSQLFADSIDMAGANVDVSMLDLEVTYNSLDLFFNSMILYLAAFLVLLASYLLKPKILKKLSVTLLGAGLAMHLVGIVLRMIIMSRPPVATLYESILFVGLVAVIFGFILELKRNNSVGLVVATVSGVLIHFLGFKYDSDGDSMGMLVAVLDTNFWLATHVVTITIGYGCCFVGGIIAHIYLVNRFFHPKEKQRLIDLSKNIKGVAIVSLFFAALGTILGGIWADQSWGRFWGWDPKENGALLIVLWLIWLIHGRVSGKLKDLGFAVGMVITNAIVAVAWFGVNLLNVGLHSYGFTQNAALNLGLFCGTEILFAVIFYILIKTQRPKRKK